MGEVRIVGPGKTHGYPYWVCKKTVYTVCTCTLIDSMMGLKPRQGNLRLVFRLFSLMRGFA